MIEFGRVIRYLLIALFAVIGLACVSPTPPAMPAASFGNHALDGGPLHEDPNQATYERGPPAKAYAANPCNAVDRRSHGASARPVGTTLLAAFAYDHLVLVVQSPSMATRGQGPEHETSGGLRAISAASVAANAGRTGARTCLRSFAGTTLVLMADGTKKPIEDVKVGDKVIATDPETGERVIRKVTHVWVHSDQVLDLVVDGEVITTTEDHLFWSVTDQRFERADQLAAGEVVLGDGGRQLRVSGFRLGTARKTLAYNLEIAGVHTYHVGENEILVHNDCDPFEAARALRGADPEDVLDAIPDNWIVSDAPKALGGGMKFSNPANRSQIIIFERGTGRASDGLHGGPYLRLSSGRGGVQRIPLLGNPSLAVP